MPTCVKSAIESLHKNKNIDETLRRFYERSYLKIMEPKGDARRHARFAITSNRTEVLFCEYMTHHLNFNGRLGVIVPEGIIFTQSNGHKWNWAMFVDLLEGMLLKVQN